MRLTDSTNINLCMVNLILLEEAHCLMFSIRMVNSEVARGGTKEKGPLDRIRSMKKEGGNACMEKLVTSK